MQVTFLKCVSDPRELNKNYSTVKAVSCEVKAPSSLYKPILQVGKTQLGDISQINYCFIADFKRYYHVIDSVMQNGGILEIQLECDVLTSFKENINGIRTLILRQEKNFDLEIIDNEMLVQNKRIIQHKNFPNSPFNLHAISSEDNCMVINVSGGE